jgi:hypothetical protein
MDRFGDFGGFSGSAFLSCFARSSAQSADRVRVSILYFVYVVL